MFEIHFFYLMGKSYIIYENRDIHQNKFFIIPRLTGMNFKYLNSECWIYLWNLIINNEKFYFTN